MSKATEAEKKTCFLTTCRCATTGNYTCDKFIEGKYLCTSANILKIISAALLSIIVLLYWEKLKIEMFECILLCLPVFLQKKNCIQNDNCEGKKCLI